MRPYRGVPRPADITALGTPSPLPPATQPARGAEPSAPIGHPLTWVQRFFGLASQSISRALSADAVQPVVDVAQGGWALATYQPLFYSTGGGPFASSLFDVLPIDTENTRAIVGGDLWMANGNAAMTVFLVLWTGANTLASMGTFAQVSVASALVQPSVGVPGESVTAWGSIMGRGDAVLVVPPGYGLGLWIPGIAVGPTVHFDLLYATIPGSPRVR